MDKTDEPTFYLTLPDVREQFIRSGSCVRLPFLPKLNAEHFLFSWNPTREEVLVGAPLDDSKYAESRLNQREGSDVGCKGEERRIEDWSRWKSRD